MTTALLSIAHHLGFKGNPQLAIETSEAPGGYAHRHEFDDSGQIATVTHTGAHNEIRSTYRYDPIKREVEHIYTQRSGYTTRAITKLDHLGRTLQTEIYTLPDGKLVQRNLVERGPTWLRRTQVNKGGVTTRIHEELDPLGRCVKSATKGRRAPKPTIAHYTYDQHDNVATVVSFGPFGTITRESYKREYDQHGNWTLERRYEWNRLESRYELKSTLTRRLTYFTAAQAAGG